MADCKSWWDRIVERTVVAAGSRWASAIAVLLVVWGLFSKDWDIVDRSATAVGLVLSLLILASTGRGDKATHLKLDELIRASRHADNAALDAEDLSEAELDRRIRHYKQLREEKGRPPPPGKSS